MVCYQLIGFLILFSSYSNDREPPTEVSLYFHCACGEIQESIGRDDEALAIYRVCSILSSLFFLSHTQAAEVISSYLPDGHVDIAIPHACIGRLLFHAMRVCLHYQLFFSLLFVAFTLVERSFRRVSTGEGN